MKRVPVTPRALAQRINRKLKEKDQGLKATRGDRWRHELGDYYIVDVSANAIVRKDVNLEKFGRQLGVLQPFEELKE